MYWDRGSRSTRWVRWDYFKRISALGRDYRYMVYKTLLRSEYTTISVRWLRYIRITRANFNSSHTVYRNKCRISGRSHFVIHDAGLARLPFKFLAGCGMLSGVARYGK